jgi:hypothetical protein
MLVVPRIQQHPDQIVSLAGWEPDHEFPYGPQGAKPKRILICPNPPPYGFLIGGHRYLFKEPPGSRAQQIWSEVIAYELSRDLRIPVPPAFLAHGPGNGAPGVLIEFFYGFNSAPEMRFVHAIERFQGLRFPIDFRRGSLADNVTLCRLHKVPGWRDWWARTLAFDAIIGNTDRHSENWGFLIEPAAGPARYALAPAFDNGTSLGYIIGESQLVRFTGPDELRRLIERGRHHFGWVAGDAVGAEHANLCRTYRDRYPSFGNGMDDALNLTDDRIDQIVNWCVRFDFALPFTEARAMFVAAQLRGRRNALAAALGA